MTETGRIFLIGFVFDLITEKSTTVKDIRTEAEGSSRNFKKLEKTFAKASEKLATNVVENAERALENRRKFGSAGLSKNSHAAPSVISNVKVFHPSG